MSDPVKSVKEQLVDLFNAALIREGVEAAYTVDDVTFGEVTPYDEGTFDPNNKDAHNTSVEVSVGEFLEQVTSRLHYTRYNLATLAGLRAPELDADADATSTYDVLLEVNDHLKVELEEEDLTDELIEDGVIVLKANPQSLQVFGQASLTIEGVQPQQRVAATIVPPPQAPEQTETTPPVDSTQGESDEDEVTAGETSTGDGSENEDPQA